MLCISRAAPAPPKNCSPKRKKKRTRKTHCNRNNCWCTWRDDRGWNWNNVLAVQKCRPTVCNGLLRLTTATTSISCIYHHTALYATDAIDHGYRVAKRTAGKTKLNTIFVYWFKTIIRLLKPVKLLNEMHNLCEMQIFHQYIQYNGWPSWWADNERAELYRMLRFSMAV